MRYLCVVSYDGTRFAGWQIQPDALSIEETIESCVSKILNSPTKIYGSGRTDAGVHAHGQTFHFDSDKISDKDKFRYSLNKILPDDIFVKSIDIVDDDFNARYCVISKTYKYLLNTGEFDPFNRNYEYQFLRKLDVQKMKEATKEFIGKHNFQNFTSKVEDKDNFIREIYSLDITENNNHICFTFVGSGFMRYMVRFIVGALIQVGLGKLTSEEIKQYLEQENRQIISYKADACGLYLEEVKY